MPARDRGAVLAVSFATVTAMWAAGFAARLPWIAASPWLVLALVLALMAAGGFAIGRLTQRGIRNGGLAGLMTAAINLLVLGGLLDLRGGSGLPSAAVWIPGALVFGALWGAAAAAAARIAPMPARAERATNWTFVLALVGAAATLVLVVLGGLVTSLGAGLAVPDWPNTYGYAMFLYPLSKMTGGIYYEHTHRLFGSLVGLTTIAVMLQVFASRQSAVTRTLSVLAVLLVVVQGVMGGLRVTGSFTLATAPDELSPSLTLAMAHGVSGQLFFSLMVVIAVLVAPSWNDSGRVRLAPVGGGVRATAAALPFLLLVQLTLGALVRHKAAGVMAHIGMSVVVGMAAVLVGTLLWAVVRAPRRLGRLGLALIWITGLQLVLGFAAFVVTQGGSAEATSSWTSVALRTAHQANGAVMLAAAVATGLWLFRSDVATANGGS